MPSVSVYKQNSTMNLQLNQLLQKPSLKDISFNEKDSLWVPEQSLNKKPSVDLLSTSRKGSITSLLSASNNMSRSFLPKDENEIDRMVSQHYILRTAFDGDFYAPLSDKAKIVLDMGCGPGTWTMEMAVQFPRIHFIGIDQYALFPQDIKPKNCRFLGLDRYTLPFDDNSIDYIFQRDANWEIPRLAWDSLIQEYYRVLKPGGWIELVEADLETQSSPNQEGFLIDTLIDMYYQKQHDPFIFQRLSSLLATGGFRRIQSDFQSIPLGWGHSKSLKKQQPCSEYARASAMQQFALLKSLKPWFVQKSRTKYEECVSNLLKEWSFNKSYINWHRSIAQKPYLS
ncbi:hypothetical protein CU098_003016 [Rhizopus stolonifer]|uniref:Methyltransferase domain-containing protein n=1 Tax=Rhizopus stolonifer TaxID=4846 RepID=A0A367IL09_RHIST|nr:hypothetical protein CU098_003016 [Rhizopus stolonifer]